jgi:hypothetical protein
VSLHPKHFIGRGDEDFWTFFIISSGSIHTVAGIAANGSIDSVDAELREPP